MRKQQLLHHSYRALMVTFVLAALIYLAICPSRSDASPSPQWLKVTGLNDMQLVDNAQRLIRSVCGDDTALELLYLDLFHRQDCEAIWHVGSLEFEGAELANLLDTLNGGLRVLDPSMPSSAIEVTCLTNGSPRVTHTGGATVPYRLQPHSGFE